MNNMAATLTKHQPAERVELVEHRASLLEQELLALQELEIKLKRPLIAGMPKYIYRRNISDLAMIRHRIQVIKGRMGLLKVSDTS